MAQHLCSFVSVPCVLPSSGFGTAFARPTVNYSLTLCHSARLPVRAMMPAPADSSCSPRITRQPPRVVFKLNLANR